MSIFRAPAGKKTPISKQRRWCLLLLKGVMGSTLTLGPWPLF